MTASSFALSLAVASGVCVPLPSQQGGHLRQIPGVAGDQPQAWTGGGDLRGAFAKARHRIFKSAASYLTSNPGQGWQIRFEDGGFVVTPTDGAWTWGLELQSYGFAGEQRAVSTVASARVEGSRMTYRWDSVLE